MQVRVRYFAAIREAVGHSSQLREVHEGTSASALLDQIARDYPDIDRLRRSASLMINQQYADPGQLLHDGDEVALIPPVSGGSGSAPLFRVTEEPIALAEVEAAVASAAAGAVISFAGTVRDHARGQHVVELEYEAYPEAAEKMLAQIGDEIAARWEIEKVAIVHRFGRLAIGEVSVAIAVSSAHRAEAFAACRYAIDRIKEIVPIWKREVYAGGATWIGSEAEYQAAYGSSGRRRLEEEPPARSEPGATRQED